MLLLPHNGKLYTQVIQYLRCRLGNLGGAIGRQAAGEIDCVGFFGYLDIRQQPVCPLLYRSSKDIVALLLKNGADINAKTRDGRTPLSVAKQYRHTDIEKMLKAVVKK